MTRRVGLRAVPYEHAVRGHDQYPVQILSIQIPRRLHNRTLFIYDGKYWTRSPFTFDCRITFFICYCVRPQ
jgi:hypothetical protein